MFPLDGGRLIRLNKDGTNGEIIQSKKPKITFGTSIVHDHHIKDVDPTNEVTCEISTDDYGRVYIHNKSPTEILLNGKAVTTTRPLLNNSIIKICDGVEFRWTYKSAKENISTENNDADFASWSDPAKKHMKQSRLQKQRPKGRLTEHAIHAYSSAIEDVAEKRELAAISDDEPDTGCSVIALETVTQPHHLPNVSEGNEATALIDFSMTETQNDNETPQIVNDIKDEPIECSTKQGSILTAQPSDCSVITLSSEDSEMVTVHDISNPKNHEINDDERFISCPPSELPDDLFESSPKHEDDAIENEILDESENAMQADNTTNTNMSIVDSVANDDDDSIIPETQDVLSQESIESLSQSQSDIERKSDLEQSELNLTGADIGGLETSQIKAANDTIDVDESQVQATTASEEEPINERDNQTEAEFNESEKLFSQADVFEDSAIEQHDVQPNTCPDNQSTADELQSSIAEAESYNDGSIPTATSSCISTIEINNAATPKMNDTTQELNLEAFNSDLEEMDRLEFTSSDSPTSSDSGNITANTSSAITTENVSVYQATDTCQTTNSSTDKQSLVDSNSELTITSTAFETDAIPEVNVGTESKDTQCSAAESEPQPTSTSQDTFERASEHADTADTNCTFEMNSSSEVSHANSSMFKVQTDNSNADCEQAQENVVSTSNEDGVIAEPSNDYVESAQRIHSMATCSTPARAISKFDTCHSIVGSTQQNVTQTQNEHCLSTQLDMSEEMKHLEQESSVENETIDGNETASQTIQKDSVLATPVSEVNDTTIELDSFTPRKLDVTDAKNVSAALEVKQTFDDIESAQNDTEATATKQQSLESVSTTDDNQTVEPIQINVEQDASTQMETVQSTCEPMDVPLEEEPQNSMQCEESDNVQPEEVQGEIATVTEQNEQTASHSDADDEVPATQIESNVSVLSTPVCESKQAFESTSIRSSRRKQPHLEIETPTARRTPRKMNANTLTETPNKTELSSTQQLEPEEKKIDDNDTPAVQQVDNVFVTPAKIDVIAKCNSTAPRSTRRNRNIFESESNTPKQTPTKMSLSPAQDTPQHQEANESESAAEQIEKIESHDEADDEILATQTASNESILSTPICDTKLLQQSTSVRSSRRKQKPLDIGTPTVQQTPRVMNANVLLDTSSAQLKESESSAIDGDDVVHSEDKSQLMPHEIIENSAQDNVDSVQQGIDENTEASEGENQAVVEESENIVSHSDADDEIPTSQIDNTASVVSTPVCDPKLAYESTSVRSSRRKQPHLQIGTPIGRRTPRRMNAEISLNTPSKPEVPTPQVEESVNSTVDGVELAHSEKESQLTMSNEIVANSAEDKIDSEQQGVDENAGEAVCNTEAVVGENESVATHTDQDDESTPMQVDSNDSVLDASDSKLLCESMLVSLEHGINKNVNAASESETFIEQNEETAIHKDEDDEIPTTQIESSASVLSTSVFFVCESKQAYESTSVRSSRRKQPHLEIETPTARRTPRKMNVNIPLETPNKTELSSTQQLVPEENKIDDNEVPAVQQEPVPVDDVFATPAKIGVIAKCNSTAPRSTRRNRNIFESESNTPNQTPTKMSLSSAQDTPQQTETDESESAAELIEQIEKIESHDDADDEIPATQTASNESILSTPICDTKLLQQSTSVRSSRRKQKPLDIGTPITYPQKLSKSIALDSPFILEKECDPVTECIDLEENPQHSFAKMDQSLSSQENIDGVQQDIDEAVEANDIAIETAVERNENEVDSEIPATQIESDDSVLSTPVFESKLSHESMIANVSNVLDTPSKYELPALQLDALTPAKIDATENETIFETQEQEIDCTQHNIETVPQSIEMTKIQHAMDDDIPCTHIESNDSIMPCESLHDEKADECIESEGKNENTAEDIVPNSTIQNESDSVPQDIDENINVIEKEIEAIDEQDEIEKTLAAMHNEVAVAEKECNNSTVSTPMHDSKLPFESTSVRSSRRKQKPLEIGTPIAPRTPRKMNVNVQLDTPSKSEVPTPQLKQVVDNTIDVIELVHSEEESQLMLDKIVENSAEDIVDSEQPGIDENIEAAETECQAVVKQNENEIDSEIPTTQIESSASVVSTPVCESKQAYESTSVRSSRRKQPHLEIETPTARRTPRKINANIPTETPNKTELSSTQQLVPEENKIDDNEVPAVQQEPVPVDDVFATPAKIDVIAKCNSTAPRSTRRNRNIFENESSTPKQTPTKMSLASTQDTPQQQETNESESAAELIEKVESHDEANDEIPATQTESNESILSTPICDTKSLQQSASVRSSRRKQKPLDIGTPTVQRTPRVMNSNVLLDTSSAHLKESESSAIDGDDLVHSEDKSQLMPHETVENSAQDNVDSVQQGIDENTEAAEGENQAGVEESENIVSHSDADDEIPTSQIDNTASVVSTPVCDSKLAYESTSVRSSRRKQPHLQIGTPIGRRTPRRMNAEISLNTPSKLEVPISQVEESVDSTVDGVELAHTEEKSQHTSDETVANLAQDNVDSEQQGIEENIEAAESECQTVIEENESVESHTDVNDETAAPQIDNTASVVSTPVCESTSAHDLATIRSSKRKQSESDIEMPPAKRSPVMIDAECEPVETEQMELAKDDNDAPSTSSIVIQGHSESATVETNHSEIVSEFNANQVEAHTGLNAMDEQPSSESDEPIADAVPQVENTSEPTEIDVQNAQPFHPNVKIIIPRIGTPVIQKLTRGYIRVVGVGSESNDARLSAGKKSGDSSVSHTSKSDTVAPRRKHPIRETEASTSQNAAKEPSSDHCDTTDLAESNSPVQDTQTMRNGNKRVGTPLPANRKKGFHKNEKVIEPNQNGESIESEAFNDKTTAKAGRSQRQKKSKETASDKNGTETPMAAVADEESTENRLETKDSEMASNSDAHKSTAPVVKASRRKRANTVTEKLTNESNTVTPNPIKSQRDRLAAEPKQTPSSTRSLRTRAIAADETAAVTPKRTRNQRKTSKSDDEPLKKTGDVEETNTEQPEVVEKPKRQARRNAKATVAKSEDSTENAAEQTDEKKPTKRTTKRTKAESVETPQVAEDKPPSVSKNVVEQKTEEKKPKRATKQAKAKPAETQKNTEQVESAKDDENAPSTSSLDAKTSKADQAEKKPKRGKGKKDDSEKVETAVAIAAPEVPAKKRTLRDRTASVCSDSVDKMVPSKQNTEEEPSTSEMPEKKRRLRDRAASIFVDKPTTSTESSKPKAKRNAKVSTSSDSTEVKSVAVVKVQEKSKDSEPKTKLKSGVKRVANDDSEALAQTPPKKRAVRTRTVSKSEETSNAVVETAKPRAKRGRKAEAEAEAENIVVQEAEEPQPPPPKRSRNTKKTTKDNEVEAKPSTKESNAEEKPKRSKKVAEKSSDAVAEVTPPIATRTRRRK